MSSATPKPSPPPFTVLVVDDSHPERNLVGTLFRQRGHRVVEAQNGAEALVVLAAEQPDLVVSDGVMPVLDGYQLCRLVKDDPGTRHIPVILLTGQAVGLSRFWARTCAADRFLLKGRQAVGVVDVAEELLAGRPEVPPRAPEDSWRGLSGQGDEAIQSRLSKALEHQLLETAMRDAISHLDLLEGTPRDLAAGVLELLHELVLPGAIHLVIHGDDRPIGIGLHGASAGPDARGFMEDDARRCLGQAGPWSSVWELRPPLKEECIDLHDPVLFSLPVGVPGSPVTGWLTLYLARHAFHGYERLFEVACHELGRLLDLLENRRHLERAEEALGQAQKRESLALMAGGIAHDINNLFQSIMGNLQVAELTTSDEQRATALARALAAVRKGADLGRRMLETSGHMWCTAVPMDVNALIRESVAAEAGLSVSLDLAAPLPNVEGDRNLLKQALAHLLANAREATGGEAGRITVSTRAEEARVAEGRGAGRWITPAPAGPAVRLTVADEGGGIPAEALERMFDPFFSTKQFGRGMGLPATLGILKAHKAGLQVENRPGLGASFQLWLPLAEPWHHSG